MCLAVPAKIITKKEMMAIVEVNKVQREVSLMLVPEANIGDFVLIHAGFAIQLIDENEAKKTAELFREMAVFD